MANMQRVGKHATTVRIDDEVVHVKYHNTIVFKYDTFRKTLVLRNGGFFTNTTKTRINQAAAQFEVPIHVFAHRGSWFVQAQNVIAHDDRSGQVAQIGTGLRFPFRDGMVIYFRGGKISVSNPAEHAPCERTSGEGATCGLCSPNNCVRI